MIVRRATHDDLPAIADLDWRALHEPFIHGPRREERREALMAVWPGLSESAEARLYVAEGASGFMGFAAVRVVVGEAELDAIAVEPGLQGSGAGRAILAHVVDDLRASSITRLGLEVRASNVRARRLYVRAGFEEEGVRRRYYENGEDALLLGLELSDRTPRPDRSA